MRLHSFVPGLAPKMKTGSRFEPGHRQKVWVHYLGGWLPGWYNRDTERFWILAGEGDIELPIVSVKFWTQRTKWEYGGPDIETFSEPSAPAWRAQAKKVLDMIMST